MMSENKKLVPKRRFREFQNADAWEQRKLRDEIEITMGQSPSSTNYTENPKDYILVQGNADMKDGRITPRVWTTQVTKKAYKGDLILSVRAPVGDVGKTDYDVVIGRGVAALKGNEFIFQILSKMKQNGYWKRLSSGSTFESINSNNLKESTIYCPNKDEQNRIGDFFEQIGNIITLHQRKLEKMKALKAACLSEMFPAEGERKPKRRFKGFADAWEQRKLGEVIDNQYNGQTPFRANSSFWNGDINWLSSGELNRDVVSATIEKITENGRKNANLKIVPKGTFVMAITGLEAAGTRGNCGKLGIDTALNQSCMALFPNKKLLNPSFLFQWYRKVGEEYGLQYTQGTKQQSYNAELIKILPIILPSVDEQILIADFLDKFDDTITFHQRKLEKLKNLKKAYLNEMFIGGKR